MLIIPYSITKKDPFGSLSTAVWQVSGYAFSIRCSPNTNAFVFKLRGSLHRPRVAGVNLSSNKKEPTLLVLFCWQGLVVSLRTVAIASNEDYTVKDLVDTFELSGKLLTV
ncbi:hypothetical protein HYX70_00345 [Candidatus Saccharibacteria bacterium]|nr:hypothetical protein [Candidatus Saccharibacteria bacterium]